MSLLRLRRRVLVPLIVVLALTSASALPAGASSGEIKDGTYTGSTGPGYPLKFKATHTSVNDLVVSFEETCNGAGPDVAPLFHFKSLTIHDDKFDGTTADTFGSTASDDLHLRGTFDGSTVTGTITSVSTIKSLGSCTETEPFSAKWKA
jgi:hypothetical protein